VPKDSRTAAVAARQRRKSHVGHISVAWLVAGVCPRTEGTKGVEDQPEGKEGVNGIYPVVDGI